MKRISLSLVFSFILCLAFGQDFEFVDIDSEVTEVQPMTGIVFWPGNSKINTDAISLEYAYMDYGEIATAKGEYDWTVVEELLDDMASRNHQAVLRFRFSYPGRTANVPQYIKDLPDYEETEGISEGKTTYFPDWEHPELQAFTLDFYSKYAERYDKDPRLAFVQVGFGLWAEYHIYSGPFKLGKTFPSKEYQKTFFTHLDSVFEETYWNISIDAASDTYSPFEETPEYLDFTFGVFDDSFMHAGHSGYNTSSWNFFDRERYKWAPAGGEFNYYTDYDQENVLNRDEGAHGVPYEIFAQNFHITYINGNDQGRHQELDRVKEASLASGYKFKLLSFKTKADSSIIELINLGVAPIYVDAYLAVNGVRSEVSLKLLSPDEKKLFYFPVGGSDAVVTIESDDILPTEEIQFFGTVNEYLRYGQTTVSIEDIVANTAFKVYPTLSTGLINIEHTEQGAFELTVFDTLGKVLFQQEATDNTTIDLVNYPKGTFYLSLTGEDGRQSTKKVVTQ